MLKNEILDVENWISNLENLENKRLKNKEIRKMKREHRNNSLSKHMQQSIINVEECESPVEPRIAQNEITTLNMSKNMNSSENRITNIVLSKVSTFISKTIDKNDRNRDLLNLKSLGPSNEDLDHSFTLKLKNISLNHAKRNSKIKIETDFEDADIIENMKSLYSKKTGNLAMRESNVDAYSNESSANFSRLGSLSKLNKMKSNYSIAKASNASIDSKTIKEKKFVYGHLTIEQRNEKARKRKETIKAKKDLEIRLQKEREENEKREKEEKNK